MGTGWELDIGLFLDWTQVALAALSLPVAVWVAGVPIRRQAKDAQKQRAERLRSIKRAADRVILHRLPASIAILDEDAKRYDSASKEMDSSDRYELESTLALPVAEWPTIGLHSAMSRLIDAAEQLDETLHRASFAVVKANTHVTRPRARRFRDAAHEFERAWKEAQ